MRHWQFWWRTLLFSTQHNPPEAIECVMVLLTLFLFLSWIRQPDWQYLALSSSFAMGAATSMWVRETLMPSPHPRVWIVVAISGLIFYSIYAFVNVADYALLTMT